MANPQPEDQGIHINVDEVCEKLHVPKEVYLRIVRKSFETTTKDIQDLSAAIFADDYAIMAAVAHRLKGTYGNLRIMDLSVLAQQMNELAKSKQGKEKIAAFLEQFKICFAQVQKIFA